METISSGTKKLPILNNKIDLDVDAELKAFELEQMAALGLEPGKEHWRDDNPTRFMASAPPQPATRGRPTRAAAGTRCTDALRPSRAPAASRSAR